MVTDKIADILLVEDNPNDAELVLYALKKAHVLNPVLHLGDGEAALHYLFREGDYAGRDMQIKPRLILLDLKMPKVDGIEVLRRVKSAPETQKIPVVILTSSSLDPDVQKCYALGANSYIVKPVDFEHFSHAVTRIGDYWLTINQPP